MDILEEVNDLSLNELVKHGKTYIYRESEIEINPAGWELWGKRITPTEDVFVYRKIVSKEEAEEYNFDIE